MRSFPYRSPQNLGSKRLCEILTAASPTKFCQRRTYSQNLPNNELAARFAEGVWLALVRMFAVRIGTMPLSTFYCEGQGCSSHEMKFWLWKSARQGWLRLRPPPALIHARLKRRPPAKRPKAVAPASLPAVAGHLGPRAGRPRWPPGQPPRRRRYRTERKYKWQSQHAVLCCEMAVSPSELPLFSLSIHWKQRERKASQLAFFMCSHFNGSQEPPKPKKTEPRKRLPLSKG